MRPSTGRTHDQKIARAASAYAVMLERIEEMTPREQAEAAWSPTSEYTVDQLEELIRAERGLPPKEVP